MDHKIYSKSCTGTIGCRFHRAWDKNFIRTVNYQSIGFTNINTNNSLKLFGSNKDHNQKAIQYLCFLANHKTINYIMGQKYYPADVLEELDEKDVIVSSGSICYGVNVGMGTKKIGIRLRLDGMFLSYDTIMTTMIHELTHMDVSNHGKNFIMLEDELRSIFEKFETIKWDDKDYSSNIFENFYTCISKCFKCSKR